MHESERNVIFKKNNDLKAIDLDDEGIIYKKDSLEEKYIANATAMIIWELIDGRRSSEDIANEVAEICNIKVEDIESEIYAQLIEFKNLDFVAEVK